MRNCDRILKTALMKFESCEIVKKSQDALCVIFTFDLSFLTVVV